MIKHKSIYIIKVINMSEKIEVQLSEEASRLVYEGYELKKDKYESFDEYKEELNVWLNLKMKETNLKSELECVKEQIRELEMKRLKSSGE